MKIEYHECDLRTIFNHWMTGYEKHPKNYEWFFDPIKEKIIFKLYIDKDTPNRKARE
jgi:hypothetical protein